MLYYIKMQQKIFNGSIFISVLKFLFTFGHSFLDTFVYSPKIVHTLQSSMSLSALSTFSACRCSQSGLVYVLLWSSEECFLLY